MATGFIQIIAASVLFGTMPLFAMNIYAMGGNPITLCVHRFLFSAPLLYLIARYGQKASLAVTGAQLKKIFVLSLSLGGTALLILSSYNYVSSGMATTIHFSYPVLVVLGCALIYREKLTAEKLLCCFLCVCGILCFYTPGGESSITGVALALGSGITYSFYMIYYSGSGLAELNSYVLTFYLSIFSALLLLLFSLAGGTLVFYTSAVAWGLAVFFAYMVTIVATVLFQKGTSAIGPENAAMISTVEPLTSIVIGVLVFSEPMTPRIAVGILCILGSILFLTISDKKKKTA